MSKSARSVLACLVLALVLPGVALWSQSTSRGRTTTTTFDLVVDANVKGASVFVAGELKGQAPYKAALAAGTYLVKVTAPGYIDWSQNVTLDKAVTLNVTLVPQMFRLTVNSNVKEASISVNNVVKGQGQFAGDFPPGTYNVTVTAAGYNPYTQSVNLAAAATVTANLTPAEATLTIPVQSLEGDVQFLKVYVDGKLANAQMAVRGGIKVPAGRHRVRVASAPVGLAAEADFDFVGGQTYEIRLMLQFAPAAR